MTHTWKRWLKSFGGKTRANAPIRRPRLGIEAMEDRIVPVTDLGAIASGLPALFADLQTGALDNQTLKTGLPLVNTALSQSSGPLQFLSSLSGTLTTNFGTITSTAVTPTTDVLGSVKQAVADAFGVAPSAVTVRDQDGNLVTTDQEVLDADRVEFTLTNVGRTVTGTVPFDFGPSLAGLGFSIPTATAGVTIGYTIPSLKFGLDGGAAAAGAFFVDLSAANDLQFTVTATPSNLGATGRLGFLTVGASNNGGTGLTGTFKVDLVGGAQVRPAQVAGLDARAKLNGGANLNLHLTADVSGATINPKVETDLVVTWPFAADTDPEVAAGQFGGSAPTVKFDNVRLDVGSLFGGFVRPYLGEVGKAIKPIVDVADTLLTPIPGLPIPITYLDLFEFATKLPSDGDAGAALQALLDLFKNEPSELKLLLTKVKDYGGLIAAATGTGSVSFGSFTLADVRGAAPGSLTIASNNGTPASGQSAVSGFMSAVNAFKGSKGTFRSDIAFPILDDPNNIFSLLLGHDDAELVTFDLAATPEVAHGGYKFSTVVGFVPVSFSIGGSVSVDVGVHLGFDAKGFSAYQAGGFTDPAKLLDGLYLGKSSHVSIVPQVTLQGDAGLTDTFIQDLIRQYTGFTIPSEFLSFGPQIIFALTASATLTGNLTLSVGGGNPADGRVRFGDLAAGGIQNAFTVSGGATFGAEGHFSYGVKVSFPAKEITKKVGGVLGKALRYVTELVPVPDFTFPKPFPGRIDLFDVGPIQLFSFGTGGGTAVGAVAAAPPVPTVNIEGGTFNASTGNWEVPEGAAVTLAGGATNVPAGQLTYSWRQLPNGSAPGVLYDAQRASLTAAETGRAGMTLPVYSTTDHPGAASPPPLLIPVDDRYRFELVVTDTQTGLTGRTTFDVVGREVNPTVAAPIPVIGGVSTNGIVVRGRPFEFRADFSDPGTTATFTSDWNFGDPAGVGNVVTGVSAPYGRPTAAFHTYARSGSYTLATTVNDGFPDDPAAPVYGRTTTPGAVTVVPAALLPDLADTSNTALYVGGTDASETITLRLNPANNKIVVIMPDFVGEFDRPTGHIYVNGYGGDDTVLFDFGGGSFVPDDGAVIDGGTGVNRYQAVGGSFDFVDAAFTRNASTGRYDNGYVDYDGATVDLYAVQGITDLSGADQFSFSGNPDADVFTVRDGVTVGATRTTQILSGVSGERGDVVLANKANVTVAGGRGADTFVLDNPNPAAGLVELDLLGHGVAADDGAADVFDVRAFAVDVFLDGAGGGDSYTVQLGGTGGRVTVFDTGSNAGAPDAVAVYGTAAGDAITVRKDLVQLGGQSVAYDTDVEALTVDGRNGDDTLTVDQADGLILRTAVRVVGGGGSNTLTLRGDPGVGIAQASVDVTAHNVGRVTYDPDGTQPFPANPGPDAEVIDFADIDTLNDVVPAARLDVVVRSGVSDTVRVRDGAVVDAAATLALAGTLPVVQFARKATAGVSTLGGADTFDVDFATPAAALNRLDLYGYAAPAAAGIGSDDNAADTFSIRATAVPVAAYGQGGDDTFVVTSDPLGLAGNLDGIGGALTLDGGAGTNTLLVSDYTSATANADARITATGITGLAGPADATPITYTGFAELTVRGSNQSGDGFTVASPAADLTLATEGGDDTVAVESLTHPADVNTGAGDDLVTVADRLGTLAGVQAALSVDGGSGANDRLVADDSGEDAAQDYTLSATVLTRSGAADVTYANIDRMTVYGGQGNNTYDVTATGATVSTLVSDGGGDSLFTIQGDALQAANTFAGNGGADHFVLNAGLGFTGTSLRLSGGAGADHADVNARVGNDVVTVRVTDTTGAGTLAGLGLTADFDTLERIDLDGNGGRNSLNWIDDTDQVFGTALTPETGIVVRPLGAASGDVRIGLAETRYPTVAFVNVGGDFTVSGDGDGSGDKDVVTVLAASSTGLQSSWGELATASGVDDIDVTDRKVTITDRAAGELRSVALADAGASPTVATLYVRGGAEGRVDGDNFLATPSARLNILLDGMDPTSGRPGDNLKVRWVGSRSLVKSRDPDLGPDHARFVQDSDGASVGFERFEKVYDTQVALTGTGAGAETHVIISDPTTGGVRYADKVPFPGFFGGVTVASADVNGDSVADVVVGAGNTGGPVVVVYDGIEGFEVARFAAYEPSFRGGVVVSAADVDGDGYADIVTGTGVGGGPRVIVLSGKDQSVLQNFFAYESSFRDGVQVAAGDTNGDGFADILTGTGRGGAPRVVLFDGLTHEVRADYYAFDPASRYGVSVGLGDLDGDFISDIIVGDGSATEPHVRAFRGKDAQLLADFMVNDPFAPAAIPATDRESGVRVGATDLDGDGIADILAGKGQGTRPVLRGYKIATVDPVTKKVSVGLSETHRETMFDPGVYGWGIEVGGSD